MFSPIVMVVSIHWTGLWTGLLDWTDGLDLICSYHTISIPIWCCKFGYSSCIIISYTSSRECTRVHNAQATWMDVYQNRNSWCTHSELKVPSYYSKYAKSIKSTDKGLFTRKFTVPWRTLVSNAMLVSGYQAIAHSLVECSHVKTTLGQQEALE